MFSAISARRIVCPLPPFASPLNLMHIDAHRSANCRDCRVARNLSPVSHWCVCDLSNSCPFYTLLLELRVPDSESKREIKEMCNAFKERSVRFLFASPHVQVLQNGLTVNWWELRQMSTKPSLTMCRVNSQGCSEDKAGVDKSRARVRAIGLKSHVPSLATLGRIFWRNADLGTFAKFSRGNSRTFNVVPKICEAKCTHRHRSSHSEVVVVLHGLKRHDGNGARLREPNGCWGTGRPQQWPLPGSTSSGRPFVCLPQGPACRPWQSMTLTGPRPPSPPKSDDWLR